LDKVDHLLMVGFFSSNKKTPNLMDV